ncbi:glycerate kinase type-2 family protein [Aliiroseovarius sp. YM-037]|uniref:glycerate kinase type-2 family protein n=1 Tax=Aliiroseovarius sp. YM-037 TaxID=3341728 RepID=UPI003A807EC9
MPIDEMRRMARRLFDAAVQAADPATAVRRYFAEHSAPSPEDSGVTYVIAIGKAAPAMLGEALDHIAGPVRALGVTHRENEHTVPGVEILRAGHPVPDQAGYNAAQRIIALLSEVAENDRVVALISGGGSALIPAPAGDLTLGDKMAVNRLLLESGLDINVMNLVRQQLSDLKGGGFLRYAAPAPVTALILSDVIGDDLRAIASGPTVAPLGTSADAMKLLRDNGIWDHLPDRVRSYLSTKKDTAADTPAENTLIGSNRVSLAAAHSAATDWDARIADNHLTGDVQTAADKIVRAAVKEAAKKPTALIFGGETTVKIKGDGRGGRNQELALRVAQIADGLLGGHWVFLSGGTDGRDGPTDAAGGVVDPGTLNRISMAGQDVKALLANNDSYAALKSAGDLLMTGATGTNVADVQILLLRPANG